LALFGPVSVPQRGICSRILQELGNPAAKCCKHVWAADSSQCQQLLPCISRSFPSMEFHISLHAFAAILRFTARAVPRESAPTAFQKALRSFDLLHPDSNPTFTTKPIVLLPSIYVINSFKFILLG
jgi:hypothetical protein